MTPKLLVPILSAAILSAAGCATAPSPGDTRPAEAAGQGEIPVLVAGPIPRSWSSAGVPLEAGGSLFAVTSDKKLDLWRIGPDRVATRLGEDPAGGFHPDAALSYDWDGDGRPEALVAGEGSNSIQLWKMRDGILRREAVFPAPAPLHIAAADLDGDGRPDIVTGPYLGTSVSVFFGKGDFDFERVSLEGAKTPAYPAIADWDNDGRPDIVWSDWFTGTVRVARNLGERRFAVEVVHDAGAPAAPRMVVPADMDGDGNVDLVVVLEAGREATVLFGDGRGGVARVGRIPAPRLGYRTGAWDPEGKLLALSEIGRVILVRRGEDGGWEMRQTPKVPGLFNVRFGDVDGDGVKDIVGHSTSKLSENGLVVFWGPLWERAQPVEMPAGR